MHTRCVCPSPHFYDNDDGSMATRMAMRLNETALLGREDARDDQDDDNDTLHDAITGASVLILLCHGANPHHVFLDGGLRRRPTRSDHKIPYVTDSHICRQHRGITNTVSFRTDHHIIVAPRGRDTAISVSMKHTWARAPARHSWRGNTRTLILVHG